MKKVILLLVIIQFASISCKKVKIVDDKSDQLIIANEYQGIYIAMKFDNRLTNTSSFLNYQIGDYYIISDKNIVTFDGNHRNKTIDTNILSTFKFYVAEKEVFFVTEEDEKYIKISNSLDDEKVLTKFVLSKLLSKYEFSLDKYVLFTDTANSTFLADKQPLFCLSAMSNDDYYKDIYAVVLENDTLEFRYMEFVGGGRAVYEEQEDISFSIKLIKKI